MLALITARGGSKGLPKKNIKLLKGKPLIAYSIEAAINAASIDKIIVSTDCLDIAAMAKKYGADVPFMRPAHLAEDDSLTIDNLQYTIERYARENSITVDEFCLLQPTSPLRQACDIDAAIELFHQKKADSVISYCQENHPISWHKNLNKDGRLTDIFKDNGLGNRQQHIPTVYPNGAVYIFKTALIQQGIYESDKTYAYMMPRSRSVDIDTADDFTFAEYLIESRCHSKYQGMS